MSANGPAKISFTDKEIEVCKKIYAKLQTGEWKNENVIHYFKGNTAAITKFNAFAQHENKTRELQRQREELLAQHASLVNHRDSLLQRVQSNNNAIEQAREQSGARIAVALRAGK